MKNNRMSELVAITLFAKVALTLFAILAFPAGLAAQDQPGKKLPFYSVIDLGTPGGTFSSGQGINDRGLVTMNALLAGNAGLNAAVWMNGSKTDLGTLGGPNSFIPSDPSNAAVVSGFADTTASDPLGLDFCFFGTHLICRGFVWQDGVMSALPTLGGNNGVANAISNLGLVGGEAENTRFDGTCASPEYEAKPVLWERGVPQELPTFPGDPDGYVNGVNDKGQAVGGSGGCVTVLPSHHALLWQNGAAIDLGNLGGKIFNDAFAVNNHGVVVGASDLPGDTNYYVQNGAGPPTIHAFLWNSGVLADLGLLPGDIVSFPNAINNRGQVVGTGNFGSRAILWHDGEAIDLNTLVAGPPFSPLYLLSANGINDRGEIVGQGLAANGDVHAFLAVPCDADHADTADCTTSPGNASDVGLNQSVSTENTVNTTQSRVPRLWRPAGTPAWLRRGTLPGLFSSPAMSNARAPSSAPFK